MSTVSPVAPPGTSEGSSPRHVAHSCAIEVPAAASPPQIRGEITISTLLWPFVRRWRLVAAALALCWATALLVILVPAREYKAELTLAAVPSARGTALTGGLSSLLGNVQMGGVQSTPYFVTRLLQLRGVLEQVATGPAPDSTGQVIERVLERPSAEIATREIVPAMRELVHAEVDKQTGLVTFAVSHADSALARYVADRLVATATDRFQSVVRAQAGDQRRAGEALVDSTLRQLRRAEDRLQRYQSSHRLYEAYATASVERQRLERDVAVAQEAHARAVADRQSAIARELEDAPAVVVVDPLPQELMPVPRGGLLKMLIATVLGVGLAAAVLAARGEFGRG